MRTLQFYETQAIDQLAWPEQEQSVSPNSSAREIFTDFTHTQPLMLLASTSAIEAEKLMRKSHVRLKLVVDQHTEFLGVVSLEDLNSQEVIKKLSLGYSREDLSVADFMRPRASLRAFDYHDIERSTIQDVVEALKYSGHQHCLVIDRQRHKIRGIISASDIARKLSLPVDIARDSSFAGIFNAIHMPA